VKSRKARLAWAKRSVIACSILSREPSCLGGTRGGRARWLKIDSIIEVAILDTRNEGQLLFELDKPLCLGRNQVTRRLRKKIYSAREHSGGANRKRAFHSTPNHVASRELARRTFIFATQATRSLSPKSDIQSKNTT
jgi:hypothetical protein